VCVVTSVISYTILLKFIDKALQTSLAFFYDVVQRAILVTIRRRSVTMHIIGVDVGGTNTGEYLPVVVQWFVTVP
jgi:hypothetical protein